MTKKEIKAQKTKYRILQSAVGLFARFGYHRTTVSEIAKMAGVTTGAVFHHFPTKEKILHEVVNWLSRGIHSYANFLREVDSPSFKTIENMISIMCDHFNRYPEATICLATLATEFSGSHHPIERVIKSVYEVFVDAMAKTLSLHPNVHNPRAAAIAFVGAVQGIAIQGLMRENEMDIDTLASGFKSLLREW